MKILGIDPGTNILGFGIIEQKGNQFIHIDHGILKLDKLDTYEKLSTIFTDIQEIIKKFKIDEVAIEAPFFGENAQSMLKLGRAQGVAIAASAMLKLPVTEYAPKKIKLSLTGKGYSSKEQVAEMVKQLLSLKRLPQTLDASDALAIAITHCMQNKLTVKGESQPIKAKKKSKGGDWNSFIKNNPDRLG